MDVGAIPIGELLPHGPEMTLIDRLVSHEPARSVAVAAITERSVFGDALGVPAWAGIEYMAQTIAAHEGIAARLRGARPRVGFLLGTRRYASSVDRFPAGSTLTISVEPEIEDGAFASFRCSISTGVVVATASVGVYKPSGQDALRLPQRTERP